MPVRRVIADERGEDDARFAAKHRSDLLRGITVIEADDTTRQGAPTRLTAIPCYAWSHRGTGEMVVWMNRR